MKNVKLVVTSLITFTLLHIQIVSLDMIGIGFINQKVYAASSVTTGSHSSSGIQSTLTSLSTSIVNMALKECKARTYDITAAMLASGVNLAGTLLATTQSAQSKGAQYSTVGNTTDTKAAVEVEKKSLEDTKSSLGTKYKFELATVAAYLVAAGISLAGKIRLLGKEKMCEGMTAEGVTVCGKNLSTCESAIATCKLADNCKTSGGPITAGCFKIIDNCELEKHSCKLSVKGSITVEGAAEKLTKCTTTGLTGIKTELVSVDLATEEGTTSTQKADSGEMAIKSMKNTYNTGCGKSVGSTTVETASAVTSKAKEAAHMAAGKTKEQEVEAARMKAESAHLALNRAKHKGRSGKEIKDLVAKAKAAKQGLETLTNVVDTVDKVGGVANSIKVATCSEAATTTCTKYLQDMEESLAKCAAAIEKETGYAPTNSYERYLIATEKEVLNSGFRDQYLKIKRNMIAALTGNVSSEDEDSIKEKKQNIFQDYGIDKFSFYLPTYNDVNSVEEYISYHEKMGVLNGKNESISLNTYKKFKEYISMTGHEATNIISSSAKFGFDLILPSAGAATDWESIGSALNLGSQTGLLQQIAGSTGKMIDPYLATYGYRGIVFGTSSALTEAGAVATKAQIDKVQDDIDKLKGFKEDLAKEDGSGAGIEDDGANSALTADTSKDIKADNSKNQNLGTGTTGSPKYNKVDFGNTEIKLDKKLPCVTKGCTSAKNAARKALTNGKFGEGIPKGSASVLGKGVKALAEATDALQGKSKITSGDLKKVANLANQKKALQKMVDGFQRQINKMEKAKGKRPTDFKRYKNKLASNITKGTDTVIAKNGLDADSLAKLFGGKKKTKEKYASNKYRRKKYRRKSHLRRKSRSRYGNDPFKEEKEAKMAKIKEDDKVNEYEDSASDIITDTSVPIWTILSTRYVKSGLRRLLHKLNGEEE